MGFSAQFLKWFNGSKVVDAQGNPQVMYHATQKNIDVFYPYTHFGTQGAAISRDKALSDFFLEELKNPKRYEGANIIPVYLSVVHPLRMPDLASIDDWGNDIEEPNLDNLDEEHDSQGRRFPRSWEGEEAVATTLLEMGVIDIDEFEEHRSNDKAFELLKEKGYDGIVYKNVVEDPGNDSWIVFSPNQIKSAIGNSAFDPTKPSITAAAPTPIAPAQTPAFKAWFRGSKVVDANGNPLRVYHGTRSGQEFEEFSVEGPPFNEYGEPLSSGSGGDPTAYMGAHFAQEPDVAGRFAVPNKGDWMASRYENEEEKPRVLPVYLSIKNPKDFGSEGNLRGFIYQGNLSGGYEEDEFIRAAMEADDLYVEHDDDPQVQEWLQNYESSASFRAMQYQWFLERSNASDNDRDDVARDLAIDAKHRLRAAGHDGVRYKNEVEGGISWIVFEPNQIKSAIGNVGQYDPASASIAASLRVSSMDNPLLKSGAFNKKAPLSPRGEQLFGMTGNQVIEEADIGDYELFLVLDRNLGIHQMGMQRKGQDFTSTEEQAEKIVPKGWGKFDRKAFKSTIQRWLATYHLLIIASHNDAKIKLYALALRALGFKVQRAADGDIVFIADAQADMKPLRRAEAMMGQMRQMQQQGQEEEEEFGEHEASLKTLVAQLNLRPQLVSRDWLLVASQEKSSGSRTHYIVSSLLKIARRHGVKKVAIQAAEFRLPKIAGFRKETVDIAGQPKDFWVRSIQ